MPVSTKPRKNGKRFSNIQRVYYYYDQNGRRVNCSVSEYLSNRRKNVEKLVKDPITGKLKTVKTGDRVVYGHRTIRHRNTPRVNEGIFDYKQEA